MTPNRQALAIGAFVLGAAAILVAGLILFGSGLVFGKEVVFVAFFDGSVKGLRVGAPITFRGVRVGTVSDMRLTVNTETGRIFIPVHLRLEKDRFVTVEGDPMEADGGRFIQTLVDRGLRARFLLQSFVTGQLMVDLDFFPDRPAVLLGGGGGLPEMPTIPSKTEEIARSIEELPVGEILADMTAAIQSISRMASSEEAAAIVGSLASGLDRMNAFLEQVNPAFAEFNAALGEARTLMGDFRTQADPIAEELRGALGEARTTLRSLNRALPPLTERMNRTAASAEAAVVEAREVFAAINALVAQQSPLRFEISRALQDLSSAARSVRNLADALERHPEALLRGKPAAGFD